MFKINVNDMSFGRGTSPLRGLGLLAVLAASLLASSCGPQRESMPSTHPPLKQDSRENLAQSLQTFALYGFWDQYASAMDSEYRKPFGQMLSSAGDYVNKLDALAGVVKERIGDKQAQMFRDKSLSIRETVMPLPQPGAPAKESIDFTKIEFLAEGVGYLVIVNQDETEFSKQFLLVQKGDQWWLTPRLTRISTAEHKSKFSQYAKSMVKTFDQYSKTTDSMIRDVRGGKLNKDNFEQNMTRRKDR